MGAYLSEPITDAISNDEHSERFSYGASSMQGWRISQEDAHNCILDFDKDTSLFAVYDGHGGAEVARYCSTHFPDFLKTVDKYKAGDLTQGLEDAFLDFDHTLTTADVKKQLKLLFNDGRLSSDDEHEVEVKKLYFEARMPIKDLMAKYSGSFSEPKMTALTDDEAKTKDCVAAIAANEDAENGSDIDSTASAKGDDISADKNDGLVSGDVCEKEDISANVDEQTLEQKTDEIPCENGVDSRSQHFHNELKGEDTIDGPDVCASDVHVELKHYSVVKATASSSSGASRNEDSVSGLRERKRDLRPKQHSMLLDNSGDDDSDDSDEEYEEANESGHGSSDDDSQDDDDDQWEDIEDEDDEDDDMEMHSVEEPGMDSGCTAVVAVVKGATLFVANAGDSRCIVCRNSIAVEMSCDHKPEDEIETKRIETAGGHVTAEGRVNGGLNLSRAIGDHRYKQNGSLSAKEQMISVQPDIQTLSIDPENDEFMVLACDGIWNMMSSQQVVDFVKQRLDSAPTLSSICEELFMHCIAPDTSGDGTGCDNMTSIIVTFQPRKRSRKNEAANTGTKRANTDESDDENRTGLKKTKTD